MDRNDLMLAVRERAFAARISLYHLADNAEPKVSGTVITRWINTLNGKPGFVPSLPTIGRLEKAMERLEAGHAS